MKINWPDKGEDQAPAVENDWLEWIDNTRPTNIMYVKATWNNTARGRMKALIKESLYFVYLLES